jgi:hypothetical protein
MDKKPLPSATYIRECLAYFPETGVLVWLARPETHFKDVHRMRVANSKYAGKIAGSRNPDGYLYIGMRGSLYLAHRVIWKLVTGKDPLNEVDHVDRIRDNNRWKNLREADPSQNRCNTGMRYNNTTGLKGAVLDPKLKQYRAAIGHKGSKIYLGLYPTAEAAHAAYSKAADSLHGTFKGV